MHLLSIAILATAAAAQSPITAACPSCPLAGGAMPATAQVPGPGESCDRNHDNYRAYCRELDIALTITWREYRAANELYQEVLLSEPGNVCPKSPSGLHLCEAFRDAVNAKHKEWEHLEDLYYGIVHYACAEGWLLQDKLCFAYGYAQTGDGPHPSNGIMQGIPGVICIKSEVRPGYDFCAAPAVIN